MIFKIPKSCALRQQPSKREKCVFFDFYFYFLLFIFYFLFFLVTITFPFR